MPKIPLHNAIQRANIDSVRSILSDMHENDFYHEGKLVRARKKKGGNFEASYTPLELALLRFRQTSDPVYLLITRLILQKDPEQAKLPYPKVNGAFTLPSANKTFMKHSLRLLARELNPQLTNAERTALEDEDLRGIRGLSRQHNMHGTQSVARGHHHHVSVGPSTQSVAHTSSLPHQFSGQGLGLMRAPSSNATPSPSPARTNFDNFRNVYTFMKNVQRKPNEGERKRRRDDLADYDQRLHAAETLYRTKKSIRR